MTPALVRPHDLKLGKLSTSTFTREAEVMRIQYARSTTETNSSEDGGLGNNTIIFIVLGVVCLLVILIGFYLVSRPRGACNPAPNIADTPLQHSPLTPPPRSSRKRDPSERWKIWRIWCHPGSTDPVCTADTPTSQVSPPSLTIITPSQIQPARIGSRPSPSIVTRPSQPRRVTSLSVATSFSHSHITEEALSDFRASAYDLDGDLETEMLHSATARDDIWPPVFPLPVEDGCGDVEDALKTRGNVTPIVEGSAEGVPSTRQISQRGGGDYESTGACQMAPTWPT